MGVPASECADKALLDNTAEKRLRMHQIMKIWRGI
jgi:hypothetical protein